jgi:hypothetical protein
MSVRTSSINGDRFRDIVKDANRRQTENLARNMMTSTSVLISETRSYPVYPAYPCEKG